MMSSKMILGLPIDMSCLLVIDVIITIICISLIIETFKFNNILGIKEFDSLVNSSIKIDKVNTNTQIINILTEYNKKNTPIIEGENPSVYENKIKFLVSSDINKIVSKIVEGCNDITLLIENKIKELQDITTISTTEPSSTDSTNIDKYMNKLEISIENLEKNTAIKNLQNIVSEYQNIVNMLADNPVLLLSEVYNKISGNSIEDKLNTLSNLIYDDVSVFSSTINEINKKVVDFNENIEMNNDIFNLINYYIDNTSLTNNELLTYVKNKLGELKKKLEQKNKETQTLERIELIKYVMNNLDVNMLKDRYITEYEFKKIVEKYDIIKYQGAKTSIINIANSALALIGIVLLCYFVNLVSSSFYYKTNNIIIYNCRVYGHLYFYIYVVLFFVLFMCLIISSVIISNINKIDKK